MEVKVFSMSNKKLGGRYLVLHSMIIINDEGARRVAGDIVGSLTVGIQPREVKTTALIPWL